MDTESLVMTCGEKIRMVTESNDLFVKIMKNLQVEHADELKNNRLHTNQLYYTRQDYSKNEKKLKRSKQQLDNVKEDIVLCQQEIIATDQEAFRIYSERVMEQGGLVFDDIEHRRLCAQREKRTQLFNMGQQLARKEIEERHRSKSNIRTFFERIFGGGLKKSQDVKLNMDVNSMLGDISGPCKDVAGLLKDIGKCDNAFFGFIGRKQKSQTKDLAFQVLNKLGY